MPVSFFGMEHVFTFENVGAFLLVGLIVVVAIILLDQFWDGSWKDPFGIFGSTTGSRPSPRAPLPLGTREEMTFEEVNLLFTEGVSRTGKILVMVTKDGCPACHMFKPVYYSASLPKDVRGTVFNVRNVADPTWFRKHKITGVPHLVMFTPDAQRVFKGPRTRETVEAFAAQS